MKVILAALLLVSTCCFAADLTVVVTAVNMETAAKSDKGTGRSYTWHSMTVEVEGATYRIGTTPKGFHSHEEWLHKGTYTGRWKDARHQSIQVDVPDGSKTRRVEFRILSED